MKENPCKTTMCNMMKTCKQCSKWCPFGTVIIGLILLIFGFILSATVIKTLWLIISAIIIVAGIVCFFMMYMMSKKTCKEDDNDKPQGN